LSKLESQRLREQELLENWTLSFKTADNQVITFSADQSLLKNTCSRCLSLSVHLIIGHMNNNGAFVSLLEFVCLSFETADNQVITGSADYWSCEQ